MKPSLILHIAKVVRPGVIKYTIQKNLTYNYYQIVVTHGKPNSLGVHRATQIDCKTLEHVKIKNVSLDTDTFFLLRRKISYIHYMALHVDLDMLC